MATDKKKTEKQNKGKARNKAGASAPKGALLSDSQRKLLLIIVVAMLILVPVVDNFRCKAACFKKIKTPYPEIACRYECPWPWERNR